MAIAQVSQPSAAAAVPNPAQITNTLATLSDQALQQYAQMHKEDPYTLSLAVAESNRRKMTRNGAAPQQPPQPPVADQAISQMAPRQLPEQSGIAQVAPQNAAPEMAGGGIVAFAAGDQVQDSESQMSPKEKFVRDMYPHAQYAAKELGIDPSILLKQWGVESGWGSSKQAREQNNFGGIKAAKNDPQGQPLFDPVEGKASPYVTYDSPEHFAKEYVAKIKRQWPDAVGAGADEAKYFAGLNVGKTGGYNPYDVYTQNMANTKLPDISRLLPGSSAQAAQKNDIAPDGTPYTDYEQSLINAPQGQLISPELFRKQHRQYGGKNAPNQDKSYDRAEASRLNKRPINDDSYDRLEQARFQRQDPGNRDLQKEAVIKAAQATAPEAAQAGMSNDDWLRIGFGLLQSKSPHFMRALGEAGNEMLTGRMAEKKYGLEALKTKAEIDRWNAQAHMWETIPQAKLDAQSQQKIATLAQQLLTKNPAYMIAQASNNQQAMAQLERQAYEQAHNNVTGSTGNYGSTVLPATGWGQAIKK